MLPRCASAFLVLLSLLPAFDVSVAPARAAHVDAVLARELSRSPGDAWIEVYVLLAARPDRAWLEADLAGASRSLRRRVVVDHLRELAAATQAPLLDRLAAHRARGAVGRVRPLWIANLLIVEARPEVVRELAAHPAVQSLHRVHPYAPGEAADSIYGERAATASSDELDNLELIRAPEVWALGYRGQGIVVANVDTGTDYEHVDLQKNTWTNWLEIADNGIDDDGNGYVDDVVGWDFEHDDADPSGSAFDEHGTNTAGIVCGDGTGGIRTGVAPRCVLMPLEACTEDSGMEAVQYAVAMGADVITSSCSYKFPDQPAYAVWREIAENERLAGVVHVNSIGNQGRSVNTYPIPYNISAPGNSPPPWLHPGQLQAGGLASLLATGAVRLDLSPYLDSGHGPSAWEDIQEDHPEQLPIPPAMHDYPWADGTLPGLVKPEVVMPTFVTTLAPNNGYTGNFGGTSAAAPHSAGAAALLLAADAELAPARIVEALMSTATDLGEDGLDNDYGAGLVDVRAALDAVLPPVSAQVRPWGQEVAAGAPLELEVGLIHNGDEPIRVRVTGHVTLPSGAPYPGNPVLGPIVRDVASGSRPAQSVVLAAPTDEPGRYFFALRIEDEARQILSRKEVQYVVR